MKIVEEKGKALENGFIITEMTATQYIVLDIFLGLMELAFYRDDKRLNKSMLIFFNSNISERRDSISCDKAINPL